MALRLLCFAAVVPILIAGDEAAIRKMLRRTHGKIVLPPGVTEITAELRLNPAASGLIITGAHQGTTLRVSPKFDGRAVFVCEKTSATTFTNFSIDGNRAQTARAIGIAPDDKAFAGYYRTNGIVAVNTRDLLITGVEFREIANFPIIVSASRKVTIDGVHVLNSGSLNSKARNNTSGGILLEEGTEDFTVRNSSFRSVRGNGVWTHSLYTSARNMRGLIANNRFDEIGRDAIQIGHAAQIVVERNTGARIGYPVSEVDMEGGGMPVAIDTAGNVDQTYYRNNRFEEINGKCFDLDGFHDGEVADNVCTNKSPVSEYPFGHFGIIFNNTNPDMQSRNIRIVNNAISGTKYGGIFIIGRGHTITGNKLTNLNTARCNETPNCIYDLEQPDVLRSGIYIGRKAERPDLAAENTITGNTITGFGMKERCIVAAPGVDLRNHTVEKNECNSTKPSKP